MRGCGTAGPAQPAKLEAAAERRCEQVLDAARGEEEAWMTSSRRFLPTPRCKPSKSLLDTLAADPRSRKAWEAITDKLGESPKSSNLVRELMKKYPDKTCPI